MRRGLRARVVATTALVASLAMVGMIVTVVLVVTAFTHNSVDSTLKDRLALLSGDIHGNATSASLDTPDDAVDDASWLFGVDRRLLDGPRAGPRTQAVARGLAGVTRRTRVDVRDRIYWAAPVTIHGDGTSSSTTGVLVVSRSLEPYETTRLFIALVLVVLGLVAVAGATAIAAWTVDRALRPVEDMVALADDWSEQALDTRFDDDIGVEFSHLGRTLNVLLDRVAGALRSEQLLTSELAHELRTPLTAIRGEAELGLMGVSPGSVEASRFASLVSLADRMSETITVLLAIARGHDQGGTRTAVRAVVEATVSGRADPSRRLVVEPAPTDVWVSTTTEMAVRALSPLVDNAFGHATGPVTLSTRVADRVVAITVSDDGPGLPPGDPELLFRAGHRDPDGGGAGLGLSLARRVARTMGGEVNVTSRTSPTSFTLTMPRY